MENTTDEKTKTVPAPITAVPVEAGSAIGNELETAGHDVTTLLVQGGTLLVKAAEMAGTDIAAAAQQLGQAIGHASSAPPVALKPAPAPEAVAPAV